jgi:hypothetical protein
MHPRCADLHAFLALVALWLSDIFDCAEMRAGGISWHDELSLLAIF